jgi:hypothetical protein
VDVSFSVGRGNVGVYSVYLNGLKGSFTVKSKPVIEPTKTTESEPEPGQATILLHLHLQQHRPRPRIVTLEKETNWALIWGMIFVGIEIIATSIILWIRKWKARTNQRTRPRDFPIP